MQTRITRREWIRLMGALAPATLAGQPSVKRLTDPITHRTIQHFSSPHHETHHYYFVSPWSPDESLISFFRFDREVGQLSATKLYPGSLWVMNADGGGQRKLVDGLPGHYHVGAGQFWGPDGDFICFRDTSKAKPCMARVSIRSGKPECMDTPAPCSRLSPDGKIMSCGTGAEQGVFDLASGKYRPIVTLERALALTPNKMLAAHRASQLQNTRFSPDGRKLMIVHRTNEDFPRLVEMLVYDFTTGQLRYLSKDLHHPGWRPDSKAIMFVRWDDIEKKQALWEVSVDTGEEKPIFETKHVPAGHPSYHPAKPHLIVTDCYGGEFGDGLALIDLKKNTIDQLVTIPLGGKPEPPADSRFPFRNWGIWIPPRKYLNEPRPVWNSDGTRILYTSQESGRINLYVVDTSDL